MFKYKQVLDKTWHLGDAEHQIDPLTELEHDGTVQPLYTILGISLEDAIAISESERLTELRAERNKRLSDCDWRVNSDVETSQEWLEYRQTLRDITIDYDCTAGVNFPTKPGE